MSIYLAISVSIYLPYPGEAWKIQPYHLFERYIFPLGILQNSKVWNRVYAMKMMLTLYK